jgi:hypothetical protein
VQKSVVDEEMIIVQFHSKSNIGDGRSLKFWTTAEEASTFKSINDVKEKLALLDNLGDRDVVSITRIPAGTEINHQVGNALQQGERAGGGLQILFEEFDPSWIEEVKHATDFINN